MQLKFLMVAKQPMWWKWWFFWPTCRDELNHAETMSPFVTLLKELIISQRTSLYMYVVLCSSLSLNIYANSVKVFSGIFSKLNNNHILEHLVIWNSTKTSKLFRDYLFNDCTLSVIMVLSSLSYTTEALILMKTVTFNFDKQRVYLLLWWWIETSLAGHVFRKQSTLYDMYYFSQWTALIFRIFYDIYFFIH